MPTISLSLTTSGAPVRGEAVAWPSAISTSKITLPVFISSATKCASSVAMNSRSPIDREPAVHHAAAHFQSLRERALVVPDLPAGPAVDRPRVIERRRSRTACRRSRSASPRTCSTTPVWNVHCAASCSGVGRRDLRQRAEALAGVVARVASASATALASARRATSLRRDVLRRTAPRRSGDQRTHRGRET